MDILALRIKMLNQPVFSKFGVVYRPELLFLVFSCETKWISVPKTTQTIFSMQMFIPRCKEFIQSVLKVMKICQCVLHCAPRNNRETHVLSPFLLLVLLFGGWVPEELFQIFSLWYYRVISVGKDL